MQRVTFQFPDVHLLWSFARTLNVREFQVSTKKICLTCKCDENYISEALTFYKAKLIFDTAQNNPA